MCTDNHDNGLDIIVAVVQGRRHATKAVHVMIVAMSTVVNVYCISRSKASRQGKPPVEP